MQTTSRWLWFVIVLGQILVPLPVIAEEKSTASQATSPTTKLSNEELKTRLDFLNFEAAKLLAAGELSGLHDIRQQQVDLNIAAYGESNWNVKNAIAWRDSADRMAAASQADQEALHEAFLAVTAGQRLYQQKLIRPAIPRIAKAAEIYARILGPDDAAALQSKFDLFQVESNANELEAARQHATEAAAGMRRGLGEHHLTTGITLSLLGMLEQKTGMTRESEEHLSQSADILRRYLDDTTATPFAVKPYVLSLIQLSILMNGDERYAEAEEPATEALICTIEKVPTEKALELLCKVQLARSHSGREDYARATKLFKEVLAFFDSVPQAPPPDFAHPIYAAYARHLRKAGLNDDLPAVEEKVQKLAGELARQAAIAAREKAGAINR